MKAAEGERDEDRWADSFLDAHVFEIERADQSNEVEALMLMLMLMLVLGTAVIAGIGVGLSLLSGTGVEGGAAFVAVASIVLAPLLLLVLLFERLRERVGDTVFAKAVRARLEQLDTRWKIRPTNLSARASARGYPRLARHFSTPRYAATVG